MEKNPNVYKMFDWTIMSDFNYCPYIIYLREQEIKPEEDTLALSFGIAYHLILEECYKRTGTELTPEMLLPGQEFDSIVLTPTGKESRNIYDRMKLEDFCTLYKDKIGFPKKVIETESYLSSPDPPYCARIDAIIEEDGLTWFVEHKTSKTRLHITESDHFLTRHGQISGQLMLGIEHFGDKFGGIKIHRASVQVVDLIEYLIPVDLHRIEDFIVNLGKTYKELEFYRENNIWPKRYNSCTRFFKTCPYLDICMGRNVRHYKDFWIPGIGWRNS